MQEREPLNSVLLDVLPSRSHLWAEDVYKSIYRHGKPLKLFFSVLIIADTRDIYRCSYFKLSIRPVIP